MTIPLRRKVKRDSEKPLEIISKDYNEIVTLESWNYLYHFVIYHPPSPLTQSFLIYYLSPQEEISIIEKEPSTPNKLQPITKQKTKFKIKPKSD